MNYVHIIGRLGKDPETRFTADGKKVTVLVVATSSYRAGNEDTIWWRVSLWGDRWDKMVSHFSKGKPIMVGGEMRKPETYTDKNGQVQLGSIDLTADYVKFVPFGKSEQEGTQGQPAFANTQAQNQPVQQPMNSGVSQGQAFGAPNTQQTEDEEPLPF